MRNKKRYILVLLLLLTVVNATVFFYRDHFAYHKKGTISSLYSTETLKWKQFVYDYPPGELAKAQEILDDSIYIQGKTTEGKVIEIGGMLYSKFYKRSGKPSVGLLSSSPLQQYQILCSSDTQKIWCGVYANMFAFFCWSKGIPCRIIEIMNQGDHHVLNECYLQETKQWAMVDLTFNRLLIRHPGTNNYVNFFDILNSKRSNLTAVHAAGNSIITTSFRSSFYDYYLKTGPPVHYYYRVNNFEVYKVGEKIKRYLLPIAWYEEVNSRNNNFLFYVKEFFLLLWLTCIVMLLIQIARHK